MRGRRRHDAPTLSDLNHSGADRAIGARRHDCCVGRDRDLEGVTSGRDSYRRFVARRSDTIERRLVETPPLKRSAYAVAGDFNGFEKSQQIVAFVPERPPQFYGPPT